MGMQMYIPPPGRPTRRSFLKRGLFGGVLLALGGGSFLALRGGKLVPPPPEGLIVLDELEFSVIHAIAGRMIPAREGFASIDQVRVAHNADTILSRADAGALEELKQLIRLFENGLANFLFGGRTKPFTQLSPEEQDAVLREWRDSKVEIRRTGYSALRAVVMASYYSSPLSWAAVGYPGPPEGYHQKEAPVFKGAGDPREGFGVWHEPAPEPAAPAADAGIEPDGGKP